MENEKAIKILKGGVGDSKHHKAMRMAIKALKKQIPQKPFKSYLNVQDNDYVYVCPACERFTETPDEMEIDSIQYCGWCGQKLDWSEEDETD